MTPPRGFVSLVGAGPGDPELITLAGVVRLAEADVIVYDRLANQRLLAHAREAAELLYAGKSPDHHALSQAEINALLIEKAQQGKRVVRLKGGDPFVFGRGGEEADALAGAGIEYDVIPGVTSAVAVPAYAGIPVTHRGIASSFAVITGHEDETKAEAGVDWQKLGNAADTLVLLMGTARLAEISGALVRAGRDADTPAAVIESGTLPRQRVVTGTLETIAESARAAEIRPPAITVVGEVVRLRQQLRWFDTRPLFGKPVLVTRTRQQASELVRALAACGAEPVELAAIEIKRTADPAAVADAVAELSSSAYDWAIFTSANAAEIFFDYLIASGRDARAFGRTQLAAIGPGTNAALARHGLRADVVPEASNAEALLAAFAGRVLRGQRVLLPRAERAREVLIDGLGRLGARVDELKLYVSVVPHEPDAEAIRRLRAGQIDVATFASSSSLRHLIQMLDGDIEPLRRVTIASIGPVTSQAVRDAGLDVAVTAELATIDGLVEALTQHFASQAEPVARSR